MLVLPSELAAHATRGQVTDESTHFCSNQLQRNDYCEHSVRHYCSVVRCVWSRGVVSRQPECKTFSIPPRIISEVSELSSRAERAQNLL